MKDFKIPPVSPLIGSTIFNFLRILRKGHILPRYYFKIILTGIIVLIATPFHIWEEIVFYRKIKKTRFTKPPLFILGHWRSGTTLLHNMITKDPSAAYITTYHSLFPNNLASKWLFRTFMKIFMPRNRPADGVELNVDFPQEDEFAFSNTYPNTYYSFFYFPVQYNTFYHKSVHLKDLSEKEISQWYSSYNKLLKKALINSGGERLIVKNPVNTGRIRLLLKLYPDAKFLYIYRNPVTAIHSTQRFLQQLCPTLWFQETDQNFINKMIFDVYNRLLNDYLEQKDMIPDGNLMELRYEEFEQDPVREMGRIYAYLLKEDFAQVEQYFTDYKISQAGYQKYSYTLSAGDVESVLTNCRKFMELYKYDLPAEVKVKTS